MGLLGENFENREEIILRDFLAIERTRLANERTLLSYLRTSLYLILGGIGIMQIDNFESIYWVGPLSFGLSFLFLVIGIIRFYYLKSKLGKYFVAPQNTTVKPE
jgi:putative membrane protein